MLRVLRGEYTLSFYADIVKGTIEALGGEPVILALIKYAKIRRIFKARGISFVSHQLRQGLTPVQPGKAFQR